MNEAGIRRTVFRHDARNLQLKRRLAELGIDFREAHPTTCLFRAPGEQQARRFAQQLRAQGFQIMKLSPAGVPTRPKGWSLAVQVVQPMERTASHEFTDAMVRCAAEYSCVYDGWRSSTR